MKMLRKYLLLLAGLFFMLGTSSAQKEGAVWYFGYGAGLDFTSHYPKPLTDGKIKTREGVASISDKDGKLLLYTDGSTIWNSMHQVMENGSGLFGNTSSTQSSMVVPKPGSTSVYYIFTVDEAGEPGNPSRGLHYSVIDMTRGGGLGAVVEKNQDLTGNGSRQFTEKITAVLHDNLEDYWIIAHGWANDNDRFFVFKLTKTGVTFFNSQVVPGAVRHENTEPNDMVNRGAVGYLKASPKGDLLAQAIEAKKLFELFSFDNRTGDISFIAQLPAGEEGRPGDAMHAAYGVEFSPTSNYLYGSTREGGFIYRWKLDEGSETKIRQSMEVVYESMSNILCGALQIAFNGKIYVTFSGQQFLGVINSPTQDDCNFVYQGASLIDNIKGEGGYGYYGLPTFLPDFFKAAEFYYENTCVNDTTLFYLSTIFGLGSEPEWTIMDSDGEYVDMVKTNAETMQGKYQFTVPGTYMVKLVVHQNGGWVDQTREVVIHPLPELNFPDTTSLCAGSSVPLDAGDGAFYRWSDNINLLERIRMVNREGVYSVTVTHNNGCVNSDTTRVVAKPLPEIESINIGQAACGYDNGSITIIPRGEIEDFEFNWTGYPDSTGNILRNLPGGVYEVDIMSNITGCVLNKKITISEEDAPPVTIEVSHTDTVCPGQEIVLTATGASNYVWVEPEEFQGNEGNSITVRPMEETTYIVKGFSQGEGERECSAFGEITIPVYPYDPPQLGGDRTVCEGSPLELDGGERFLEWEWSTGSTERYITIDGGMDSLILTTMDPNGCYASDTINLHFVPLPEVNLGPDRTLCLDAPIELDAGDADTYTWNTGDTTRVITVSKSQVYEVSVSREGCSNADEVLIQFNNPDSLRIDSVRIKDITCFGANNGQVRVYVRGEGTNYQYSLDNGLNYTENGGFFESLGPGDNYLLKIMEDSACTIEYNEPISLTEPEENHPLNLFIDSVYVKDVTCYGSNNGQIVVFSHGEGLSYEYSIDGGQSYEKNSGVFENLAPGEDYVVMVREDEICTVIHDDVISFSEPSEIVVDYQLTSPSCEECDDGQILLNVSGGNSPYDVLWSNFETGTRRVNIPLGEYSVAITDQSNCRVIETIVLDMGHGSLKVPNAFTPNDDGVNDTWIVEAVENYPDAVIMIFDRFGKMVFESPPGYPEPWDGRYEGEYVPVGTYYFLIKLDGFSKPVPGSLTVIR
jgi:gliding motility-associated-like protein